MNWEAIGAIGEVLGAFGVIVTLAYLAIQIRQNSHQLERSSESARIAADDAVARGFDLWRQLFISDEALSEIYIRGLQDIDTLSPNERLRFNQLMSSFIWTGWQFWRSEGLVGRTNSEIFRHLLRHRGAREWYATARDFLPADFREMLDDEMEGLIREGVGLFGPGDASSMLFGSLKSRVSRTDVQPSESA